MTDADWDMHAAWNKYNAEFLTSSFDAIIVHDPQPAALPEFARDSAGKWIWRSHIDTSAPDSDTWSRLSGLVQGYDAAVFSLPEFAGPGLDGLPVSVMPPAIDPFTHKNRFMSEPEALSVVAKYGIDPQRPFITQVSRFDPWKDPLGVIECFRRLKPDNPELQLAMCGNFADDDPEGRVMYDKVVVAAQGTPDIHIVLGLTDLVGPFQQMSSVIIQKSLKEGFGLTATEALWKGTPVIAGNVGGLRLQVANGVGGFLVDSIDECAERVDFLINHTAERDALGAAGREHVRKNFLLPRLLRDEMLMLHGLLNTTNGAGQHANPVSLEGASELTG
jgi:trehalose synthase